MKAVLIIVISYFLGCFSGAYFIGKTFKKMDIRTQGSGNAGTTNAVRVMGKKLGLLTLVLDYVKGVIAVLIGYKLMGYNGGLLAAAFVVLGHDFPVFLGFRGGKGVATTIAAFCMFNFFEDLFAVIAGFAAALLTGYVSLGSMVYFISLPIMGFILGNPVKKEFIITSLLLSALGIYKHKDNIKRLISGNENKIGRWSK